MILRAISIACRVSSELILMLSLASMNTTPYELNNPPTQSTASEVWPIGRPTGKPALCSFCADSR